MIYLDHAATTPLHPEARRAMEPFLTAVYGNPSSLHAAGQAARRALDDARDRMAAALGALPEEVLFTRGGTEANNLALTGVFLAHREDQPHFVTAATEHHSVLDTCRFLETLGAEVTVLPVDEQGRVDPNSVRRAITARTVLVSIMHANNEIGTIAPLDEIAAVAREVGVPLHTDAVQSVGALPVDLGTSGVSLLALSTHKFYGPKGTGALLVRRGTRLRPLLLGGSQERGRRAGTENVAGIIGMARALELALADREAESARQALLRDRLIHGVLAAVPDAVLNGHAALRLPNNANFSFPGLEAEPLLLNLDLEGIAASSGSACSAGSLEPSHVVRALGRSPALAAGTLRLTVGRGTTEAEIDTVIESLVRVVRRLRRPSRSSVPSFRYSNRDVPNEQDESRDPIPSSDPVLPVHPCESSDSPARLRT
jgi:cysteine desulfurase